MSFKSIMKFVLKNHPLMMIRMNKTINEFYRASFISSALSHGLYDILRDGPMHPEEIAKSLGLVSSNPGLEAWLEFGTSLGELGKNSNGYGLKGALSKHLAKPRNDTWQAFLQARVGLFYEYIINTPALLKAGTLPELDESYGELFARSSRTVETIILDIVDKVIPLKGKMTLLMIKTLEKTDDKKTILKIFGNSNADQDAINKVIKIMHDAGSINYCKKLALHFNKKAKDNLEKVNIDSHYERILSELADFMISRNF